MEFSAHARARSRRFAMQALYQWDLSGMDLAEIQRQFAEADDFNRADRDYFIELLKSVPARLEPIDRDIAEYLDRPMTQVDPVERAILRIATYELLYRIDVPYRVILNEAITLTRKFGAEQGHAFVNGVLDKLARKLRPDEYSRKPQQVNGL
jgi:N utilization substance protein B